MFILYEADERMMICEIVQGIIEAAKSDDITNIEHIILEHQSEEDLRQLIRTRDKTKVPRAYKACFAIDVMANCSTGWMDSFDVGM